MKQYTVQELRDFVNAVFADVYVGREGWKITVIKQTDKELLFEATHMYDCDDGYSPSFQQLTKFSELFGTNNIDKYEDISVGGCETCDYGSRYGFALRVWE